MAKLKDGFYKQTAEAIGSDLHVLLAGGGSKALSDFATSTGVVTALGTSGNYVTWTKNGTANNLTVPYATKAGTLDCFARKATANCTWGTLTASNGYTPIYWGDSASGGGIGFSDKGGQTFMQIDGDYYAQEGAALVLHTSNYTSYVPKKDGTGASGTWGINISGNAATASTATKATQDSDGNTINSTYLKKSGGTLTGALTFANGTWNVVGDDAAIGDYNTAGSLGLKSVNNNIPSIGFHNSSNTLLGTLKCDAGTLKWNTDNIVHGGNYNAVLPVKLLNDPGQTVLKNSYGLNASYGTSSYGNPTEEYLKAFAKYLQATAPGYTCIGYVSPNSRGAYVCDVYNSGTNSSTGLPEHITGHFFNHGGTHIAFGTSYGRWYYYSFAFSHDIPTKVSQLTNDLGFLTQHQSLANYVTLNTAQTISATKTFSAGNVPIKINSTGNEVGVQFLLSGAAKGWVGHTNTTGTYIYNYPSGKSIGVKDDGTPYYHNGAFRTLLHSGNYSSYALPFYTGTSGDCNTMSQGLTALTAIAGNQTTQNHSAFLTVTDIGTPFQLQIPDSSTNYIYKRYKSGSTWSAWSKLSAGYADTAGSAVDQTARNTANSKWTYNEDTIKAVKVNNAGSADNATQATQATNSLRLMEYYNLDRNHDSIIIKPNELPVGIINQFTNSTGANSSFTWNTIVSMSSYSGGSSSGAGYRAQFLFPNSYSADSYDKGTFYIRYGVDDTWKNWTAVVTAGNIGSYALTSLPSHTHDDRYYTESEIDTKLAGKAASSHTHTVLTPERFDSGAPAPNSKDGLTFQFSYNLGTGASGWSNVLNMRSYTDKNYTSAQIITPADNPGKDTGYSGDMKWRQGRNSTWLDWKTLLDSNNWSSFITIPSVGNGTVTINQAGSSKGSFTLNQSTAATINLTDTNYYPTAFSWTGGTTAGPTGSLTGVGMSAVKFGAIPAASSTASGIVTTGNQSFSGQKTFETFVFANYITPISDTTGCGIGTDAWRYHGGYFENLYTTYIYMCPRTYSGTLYLTGLKDAPSTTSTVDSKLYASSYVKVQNSASSSAAVYAPGGFYESSDERLKNLLKPVRVDLDELSKLRKVYYTWKNSSDLGIHLGIVAQDVQKLYPELVTVDSETGYLSLSYDKLSVIALEAIDTLYESYKELKRRVDTLEKLITNKGIL